METTSMIVGLIVGLVLAYIIFNLLNKTKNVSKSEFDALTLQYNEKNTLLKVAEDRLESHKLDYTKLSAKHESREAEIKMLQNKNASNETNTKNLEEKIEILNISLSEQTKTNGTLQDEVNFVKQQYVQESTSKDSFKETVDAQKETIAKQVEEIKLLNEKVNKITSENSTLIANNNALNEKLTTQKEEILEMQKTSHLQFEKIANQILEEKTGKFTESNKTSIEALLKPLGENIDTFKKKVEETYDKESKQRFSLEEKVKELVEQTNKVSTEANNLASALKGQVKKQGNWGEMILESILQKSGLEKDREYFLQQTIKDDDGNNLRPDVLVKLPGNRIIIIDSKVSLVAYDRYSSADAIEQQKIHLQEHLNSIYAHVDSLASKKYDNIDEALDFTMMFVPIEPAYLIAIQADQELWAYAYAKRILLISPTNLIACFKLMADLWKREMQSKNAMEIVKRGELLYEKFVAFVTTLEDVGKHINKTQQSYNSAIGQLNSGTGNLLGQALKLKNLGLKSSKEIPTNLLSSDFEIEEGNGEKEV